MIQITDSKFINDYLNNPELSDFWNELGGYIEIPDSFISLYNPNVGMILFEPVNYFLGVHIAILPKSRGKEALNFVSDSFKWIFDNTHSYKILARIEIDRPEVILFSKWAGMKEYNTNKTHYFCEVRKCH